MTLRNCSGYNEFGGATYLLRGWWMTLSTLDTCSQAAGGAVAATGASGLVQINGNSNGHLVMRSCSGAIYYAGGNACTWQAYNSSGTSPIGNLNMRGITGNV